MVLQMKLTVFEAPDRVRSWPQPHQEALSLFIGVRPGGNLAIHRFAAQPSIPHRLAHGLHHTAVALIVKEWCHEVQNIGQSGVRPAHCEDEDWCGQACDARDHSRATT